jgi:hypothetical protein
MSDTPRTDSNLCRYEHPAWPSGRLFTINDNAVVLANFARQLERELAAAKALAESNGKLAHDLGIQFAQSKEANAGLMKACKHLESKMKNLREIYKIKHKTKP